MTNLYINGYIKKDKIQNALHYAKYKGKLLGVSDQEIKVFVDKFLEVSAERHYQYGDQINQKEVGEILKVMERDHTDIIDGEELETIENILMDKYYQF